MSKASFTRTRITVDGRTYSSVEDMPPDVRRRYDAAVGRLLDDRDGNGVPDVFESETIDGADVTHVSTTTSEFYEINGRRYDRLDQVPPEFRKTVERLHSQGAGTSGSSPNARGGPFRRTPPSNSPPTSGLHIHLSWPAVACIAAGLALAAWVAYRVWGR